MKYFTPELHVRLQDASADRMDAADEEWERALANYQFPWTVSEFPRPFEARIDELCATTDNADGHGYDEGLFSYPCPSVASVVNTESRATPKMYR